MKMYLISDNIDTLTGMRLAGIDGIVVHDEKNIEEELERIIRDKEVGVLLITEIINQRVEGKIADIKLNYALPLIVVVPDRHGSKRGLDSITKYVREAIGLKI